MTSKQISRDDVEDVGVLQMIRKTFGMFNALASP